MTIRRFYIENLQFIDDLATILGEERNHLVNVLRLKNNEQVIIVCGDGFDYHAKIESIDKKCVVVKLLEKIKNVAEPKRRLTLFQGVAKGEKMDLITQKLTELGGFSLQPFLSEFTVPNDGKINLERLNRISREAVKQCKRANALEIQPCVSFDEMTEKLKNFDLVVFAYEHENEITLRDTLAKFENIHDIAVIVGAEGGFSEKENQTLGELENVCRVTLGKRILRCETAAISLCSILMYEIGEMN